MKKFLLISLILVLSFVCFQSLAQRPQTSPPTFSSFWTENGANIKKYFIYIQDTTSTSVTFNYNIDSTANYYRDNIYEDELLISTFIYNLMRWSQIRGKVPARYPYLSDRERGRIYNRNEIRDYNQKLNQLPIHYNRIKSSIIKLDELKLYQSVLKRNWIFKDTLFWEQVTQTFEANIPQELILEDKTTLRNRLNKKADKIKTDKFKQLVKILAFNSMQDYENTCYKNQDIIKTTSIINVDKIIQDRAKVVEFERNFYKDLDYILVHSIQDSTINTYEKLNDLRKQFANYEQSVTKVKQEQYRHLKTKYGIDYETIDLLYKVINNKERILDNALEGLHQYIDMKQIQRDVTLREVSNRNELDNNGKNKLDNFIDLYKQLEYIYKTNIKEDTTKYKDFYIDLEDFHTRNIIFFGDINRDINNSNRQFIRKFVFVYNIYNYYVENLEGLGAQNKDKWCSFIGEFKSKLETLTKDSVNISANLRKSILIDYKDLRSFKINKETLVEILNDINTSYKCNTDLSNLIELLLDANSMADINANEGKESEVSTPNELDEGNTGNPIIPNNENGLEEDNVTDNRNNEEGTEGDFKVKIPQLENLNYAIGAVREEKKRLFNDKNTEKKIDKFDKDTTMTLGNTRLVSDVNGSVWTHKENDTTHIVKVENVTSGLKVEYSQKDKRGKITEIDSDIIHRDSIISIKTRVIRNSPNPLLDEECHVDIEKKTMIFATNSKIIKGDILDVLKKILGGGVLSLVESSKLNDDDQFAHYGMEFKREDTEDAMYFDPSDYCILAKGQRRYNGTGNTTKNNFDNYKAGFNQFNRLIFGLLWTFGGSDCFKIVLQGSTDSSPFNRTRNIDNRYNQPTLLNSEYYDINPYNISSIDYTDGMKAKSINVSTTYSDNPTLGNLRAAFLKYLLIVEAKDNARKKGKKHLGEISESIIMLKGIESDGKVIDWHRSVRVFLFVDWIKAEKYFEEEWGSLENLQPAPRD